MDSKSGFFLRQDVVFESQDDDEARHVGLNPVANATGLTSLANFVSSKRQIGLSTDFVSTESTDGAQTTSQGSLMISDFELKRQKASPPVRDQSFELNLKHTTNGVVSSDDDQVARTDKSVKLFSGLTFYFVPSSRINAARKARMTKVEALGGVILATFDMQKVTHIIVDKNITATILLKHIKTPVLDPVISVLNEHWTPDCVIYNKLLGSSAKYVVEGTIPRITEALETPADGVVDTAVNHHQSLQVREPKSKALSQPETDQSLEYSVATTISPSKAFASAPIGLTTRDSSTIPTDELDNVIATVKALGTVQLEDEDLPSSIGADSEVANASKYKTFKCMKAHELGDERSAGPNDFVIEKLKIMQTYYETSHDPVDKWKPRGYRLAISSLKQQIVPIRTYEAAKALPHIGDRLANHIVEIAKTGTLERADSLGDEYEIVRRFMGIYGVGPTKANEFVSQGYKTLEDLSRSGLLNRNQQIGIELYEDLNTRMHRAEVDDIKTIIKLQGAKIDKALQIYVMGSYRRGAPDCGDVDFMLTRENTSKEKLVKLWQRLLHVLKNDRKFLTHALVTSNTRDGLKWQGICKLQHPCARHRRIDFLLVPWEQRGAALLYFTGNDLFNRSMRLLARKKGYTLNEKALMKGAIRDDKGVKITEGTNTGIETEEEIFKCLGVPYRAPHERCIS